MMHYVSEMDDNAKQVITDLIREKMDCHFPEDLVHRCGVPSAAWREDGVIELCAYVDTYNMADRDREWFVEAEIDTDGVVNLINVSPFEPECTFCQTHGTGACVSMGNDGQTPCCNV